MNIYELLKSKNRPGRQDKRFLNKEEREKRVRVRINSLNRRERNK